MAEFLQSIPLFPLVLTVGAYQIGLWCQKKTRSAICNPLLIAVVLCIGVILLTGMDPQVYQSGTASISWLLTPATVCLAVPLYEHVKILRSNLKAILIGIATGTVSSLLCIYMLCKLFALDDVLTVSLFGKSITTAIALELTKQGGGIPSLTSAGIVISGILGNLSGSAFCKLLKITNPVAQGVGFGTASHAIGTARANEVDPVTGAASSLSLVVAGILTAILFPLVLMLL
ncbi:MAG: LrgB family protein [Anaerotignum sp.]|nr:LrgB family protein [Anaerotignum sp.]